MWPYIIGEPTESGEVDMKMEEREEDEKEKTNILNNLTLIVWGPEVKIRKMSLDPRSSMANSSASDILMGQFPEQGSELVSWLPYSTYL